MKAVILFFFLFIGFSIARYLTNLFRIEAKGVKTYRLSPNRQFSLLFYGLLCAIGGFMTLYSALTGQVRDEIRVALYFIAPLLLLLFGITFWLHLQYAAYQGSSVIRYNPADLDLTLTSPRTQVKVRRADITRVLWVRCRWPRMVWSEYEYMVIHLHNGSRLLVTSFLLPLPDLRPLFAGKEVRVEKRLVCRVNKDF